MALINERVALKHFFKHYVVITQVMAGQHAPVVPHNPFTASKITELIAVRTAQALDGFRVPGTGCDSLRSSSH